jgi:hypothetical protein
VAAILQKAWEESTSETEVRPVVLSEIDYEIVCEGVRKGWRELHYAGYDFDAGAIAATLAQMKAAGKPEAEVEAEKTRMLKRYREIHYLTFRAEQLSEMLAMSADWS